MRVRVFIVISIMLPVVFLFGLESYLERYDVHSKYLSELKNALFESKGDHGGEIGNLPLIIESIDAGNFSEASACLRAGRAAGVGCVLDSSQDIYKSISNIDILKGGYKKRDNEYIEDFRDKVIKIESNTNYDLDFDFNYDYISNNDVRSWENYNFLIGQRYGYYSSTNVRSEADNIEYINGGGVFFPHIFYSSLPPIPGGRIRILAISDSFGAGAGLLSLDDSWPRELESQLNKNEDKYEVVVLAHGGAGYNDFLNWVEEGYIEAIDPDIVLLSYFQNDFNLLHDFGGDNKSFNLLNFDKELVFYLRCFEKEDDFIGKSLKRLDRFYPSIYRYYKFSNCSEELSRYDDDSLINKLEVVNTYKEIDRLIKVPSFLYKIEFTSTKNWANNDILKTINANGFNFINNSGEGGAFDFEICPSMSTKGLLNCEDFKANIFNPHFNRYYNKMHISGQIEEIKSSIDLALTQSRDKGVSVSRVNKSGDLIVDYLPNTLFVSNIRERSSVGFFKNNSYGRNSENFCVPFDRKGVMLNFNKYLSEGKEIKISSEFQRSGLGLVSRGYDKEGREVFGEAIELLPGKPVKFIGSESVRGIVVLSNNKNCGSRNRDNKDEFLLHVEVL